MQAVNIYLELADLYLFVNKLVRLINFVLSDWTIIYFVVREKDVHYDMKIDIQFNIPSVCVYGC